MPGLADIALPNSARDRHSTCPGMSERAGNPWVYETQSAPFRDFFHAFPAGSVAENRVNVGSDEMKPGKKLVAGHRDQDTRVSTTDGIQLNELVQADVLSITTTNNTYHVTVIDPETAQVRVRGGFFPSDTLAQIAGSSLNSSIKPLGIYVGYSIEFFVHAMRVRTSPVHVIRVLAESSRAA